MTSSLISLWCDPVTGIRRPVMCSAAQRAELRPNIAQDPRVDYEKEGRVVNALHGGTVSAMTDLRLIRYR